MTKYDNISFTGIPGANGFHVYTSGSGREPGLFKNRRKTLLCFIALQQGFYVDGIKIPENHIYGKVFEAGTRIIKKQRSFSSFPGQLLIVSRNPEFLSGKMVSREFHSGLDGTSCKLLLTLLRGNIKSAAGSLMGELSINALIAHSCFGIGQKADPALSLSQAGIIREWFHDLNSRNEKISEQAAEVGIISLSGSASGRLCKQLYRRSARKLAFEIRMQHAIDDLLNTSKPLDKLGMDSGYRSREHFITAFKKHFGISPGELRTKTRNLTSVLALSQV